MSELDRLRALVASAVRHVPRRRGQCYSDAVADVFGISKKEAIRLCREYGVQPENGYDRWGSYPQIPTDAGPSAIELLAIAQKAREFVGTLGTHWAIVNDAERRLAELSSMLARVGLLEEERVVPCGERARRMREALDEIEKRAKEANHTDRRSRIDGNELDGLRPKDCFVLGVEWQMVSQALDSGEPFARPIHPANSERIKRMLIRRGRRFKVTPNGEAWLWLEVE